MENGDLKHWKNGVPYTQDEIDKGKINPWTVDYTTVTSVGYIRQWKDVKTATPAESGRYWCVVEEQNDLGRSTFQWNVYYNKYFNRWSDQGVTMKVTHWTDLLPYP